MIKYLVTSFWEIDGACGFECTSEDSIDEWLENNRSFLKEKSNFKSILVNVFPIPNDILEKFNDEDEYDGGISANISYNY
jgi:hypothetical protein